MLPRPRRRAPRRARARPRRPARAPARAAAARAADPAAYAATFAIRDGSRFFTARRSRPASIGLTSTAVDVGALGEELVGFAVEQEQDRHLREPALAGLEPQVERDRDAAHVADLHVEDHDVRLVLVDGLAHVLAALAPRRPAGRARRTPPAPGRGSRRLPRRRGSSPSAGHPGLLHGVERYSSAAGPSGSRSPARANRSRPTPASASKS